MPRDVTIICLLEEIKHLRQVIEQTPELHYVGFCQWRSTRPSARIGQYTHNPPGPDSEVYTDIEYKYNG